MADYLSAGYALFELAARRDRLLPSFLTLTGELGLGAPFVPPLYGSAASDLYDKSGLNAVTAAPQGGTAASHPAFASRNALELHVDGTLQSLGEIPTSALLCATPARQGGDTILFHAVAAFLELEERSPSLVRPTLDPRALTRHATVSPAGGAATGPVFGRVDGELLSRYSTTPRDRWSFSEVAGLREASIELAALAQPASPFLTRIRLEAGQGIIFANDRLAHGRTHFEDDPANPRLMLRGLFLERPG